MEQVYTINELFGLIQMNNLQALHKIDEVPGAFKEQIRVFIINQLDDDEDVVIINFECFVRVTGRNLQMSVSVYANRIYILL